MQKREIAWIAVLLLLAGIYFCCFGHWGEKHEIQVLVTIRPPLQSRRRGGATPPAPSAATNAAPFRVLVALDAKYKLTDIKLSEVNEQPGTGVHHALWHLVSKTGSPPIKVFPVGQAISNMEPDLKGVEPEPLAPGTPYRLEVSAGKLTGASPPFVIPARP